MTHLGFSSSRGERRLCANERNRSHGRALRRGARAHQQRMERQSISCYLEATDQGASARRTLGKSVVRSTIKDIARAEGVASRHLHHERSVLKNRTGAIGDAAVTASEPHVTL